MPEDYLVIFTVTRQYSVEISANSKEDAIKAIKKGEKYDEWSFDEESFCDDCEFEFEE